MVHKIHLISVGLMLCVLVGCQSKAEDWKLSAHAYTFRNFTLFETIEKTKSLGLKYVEGFEWQLVSADHGELKLLDASDEVLAEVNAKMASEGISMLSYYSSIIGANEERTARAFKYAKTLGAHIIVCEPPASALLDIDEMANQNDMYVAIHNHPPMQRKPGYTNWNPDSVLKMIEGRSPRIGCCADVGHWVRSGIDPEEGLKKYKGKLLSLHLKDVETKGDVKSEDVTWGTGEGKIKEILTELDRQDFKGVLAIEYEANPEDNMAEIRESIAYYRDITKSLGR